MLARCPSNKWWNLGSTNKYEEERGGKIARKKQCAD
jgi:hypothetical protein